jgi:hypothetical protein
MVVLSEGVEKDSRENSEEAHDGRLVGGKGSLLSGSRARKDPTVSFGNRIAPDGKVLPLLRS